MHQSVILLGWPEIHSDVSVPSCGKLQIHFLANPMLFSWKIPITFGSWYLVVNRYHDSFSWRTISFWHPSWPNSLEWCPLTGAHDHIVPSSVFSVMVYHSCWIYLRVGKSTSVKLWQGLNRKSFTWLSHNSALTHAHNIEPRGACYLSLNQAFEARKKVFPYCVSLKM